MPKLFNEERIVFSSDVAETTVCPHSKRMKLDPYLKHFIKISSKFIKHLNMSQHYKKIGVNLHDLGFCNGF